MAELYHMRGSICNLCRATIAAAGHKALTPGGEKAQFAVAVQAKLASGARHVRADRLGSYPKFAGYFPLSLAESH